MLQNEQTRKGAPGCSALWSSVLTILWLVCLTGATQAFFLSLLTPLRSYHMDQQLPACAATGHSDRWLSCLGTSTGQKEETSSCAHIPLHWPKQAMQPRCRVEKLTHLCRESSRAKLQRSMETGRRAASCFAQHPHPGGYMCVSDKQPTWCYLEATSSAAQANFGTTERKFEG